MKFISFNNWDLVMEIKNLTSKVIIIFIILHSQLIIGQSITWQQTNGPLEVMYKQLILAQMG